MLAYEESLSPPLHHRHETGYPTLSGSPQTVFQDVSDLKLNCSMLGPSLNSAKCEIVFHGLENNTPVEAFQPVLPGVKVVALDDLDMLGAPVRVDALSHH